MSHPASPPRRSRPWLLAAAAALATALLGLAGAWWAVAVLCLALALVPARSAALVAAVVALSTLVADRPLPTLAPGVVTVTGTLATDVTPSRFGAWALLITPEGPVLLDFEREMRGTGGDLVEVKGSSDGEPGVFRGRPHRGVIAVSEMTLVADGRNPMHRAGGAVRDRVLERIDIGDDEGALLAGFLIGDTTGIDPVDLVAMRRSGLSHFTAVSGSNVALVLGLVYLAMVPLTVDARVRAVAGLAVLPVYAAATRFEPSVLRASAMAGMVLAGRLAGIVLEAWQLLAAAVICLVVLDPYIATSLGFQLSVAATGGVLVGARWPVGRWGKALAVTIGAQAAVAPLLLAGFGKVPLLSPLANLLAAPLVAGATVLAAAGVAGAGPALPLAEHLAGVILAIARATAWLPQLDTVGVAAVAGVGLLYGRGRRARPLIALLAALVVGFAVVGGRHQLPAPAVAVLDVGQGDAILVAGGEGRHVLIDGGPDPARLMELLDRYQVQALDLVVVSHVHGDHTAGLAALPGRLAIGQVWASTASHRTPAWDHLEELLGRAGVPVVSPPPGTIHTIGEVTFRVLGPRRRYASPNDQSIVLLVIGPARTVLLPGDIETVAQGELTGVSADVLKVPHQGAATSDPDWLRSVGASLAVISVGPNDFGHPAPWVIELLLDTGAEVRRTDRDGDVVIPLS